MGTTAMPNGGPSGVNITLAVRDHALRRAEELETEGRALIARARDCYAEAAMCRMHHAITDGSEA